jgi:hypothetical protein
MEGCFLVVQVKRPTGLLAALPIPAVLSDSKPEAVLDTFCRRLNDETA